MSNTIKTIAFNQFKYIIKFSIFFYFAIKKCILTRDTYNTIYNYCLPLLQIMTIVYIINIKKFYRLCLLCGCDELYLDDSYGINLSYY